MVHRQILFAVLSFIWPRASASFRPGPNCGSGVLRRTRSAKSIARFASESWGGSREGPTVAWEEPEENETEKWERIWREHEKQKRTSTLQRFASPSDEGAYSSSSSDSYAPLRMRVAVVSFDLDDTLWRTDDVITQANDALAAHLERNFPDVAADVRIPDLMKAVWREQLAADPALDPSPVNLTKLRKDALRRAAELCGIDPAAFVEPCFEIWREQRHRVQEHLFPGALETLRALRRRGLRLIAITNGNADTDRIDCLRDVFEFCVMAEAAGARKPDARIFHQAILRAGYASPELVGGEWLHVGDDFTSDCIGAKAVGMRTIHIPSPQSPPKDGAAGSSARAAATASGPAAAAASSAGAAAVGLDDQLLPPPPSDSAAATFLESPPLAEDDVALFEVNSGAVPLSQAQWPPSAAEVYGVGSRQDCTADSTADGYGGGFGGFSGGGGGGNVMTMEMGSQSYLADMISRDFVDARCESIADVLAVVDRWNDEAGPPPRPPAASASALPSPPAATAVKTMETAALAAGDIRTAAASNDAAAAGSRERFLEGAPAPEVPAEAAAAAAAAEHSECASCGAELPPGARFCLQCGVPKAAS
ncbi:unnamed protein product [Phaeothamnion confervicola]